MQKKGNFIHFSCIFPHVQYLPGKCSLIRLNDNVNLLQQSHFFFFFFFTPAHTAD